MVYVNKLKPMIYFGHPTPFWRDRQRTLTKDVINVERMKKLGDIVDYDSLHLQKAIINRTTMKLQKVLDNENKALEIRRLKLKEMLKREKEYYVQELITKQETEECSVCVERERKLKSLEEELELEKIRECEKALEREKIAKGMQCSREDEIRLREMQLMQMEEKRRIAMEEKEIEGMWHQVLINNVKRKEYNEIMEEERRRQEMLERRRLYDEQIANAARNRSDTLQREKEKENRRIESMRRKMEEDYLNEIRKKKEQKELNKKNYIEGHKNKIIQLKHVKQKEFELDKETIQIALEGLREERMQQLRTMNRLQTEKQIYIENVNREKKIAEELERESEQVAGEWRRSQQNICDEQLLNMESEKRLKKEKLAEDYRNYLEDNRRKSELDRLEREATMERVRQKAIYELQLKLDNANEEYRKQLEYRNSLNNQIEDNQKIMHEEQVLMENKLRPFTEKMELFKDVMRSKVDKSPGRLSTNPVHPFARQKSTKNCNNKQYLPLLNF